MRVSARAPNRSVDVGAEQGLDAVMRASACLLALSAMLAAPALADEAVRINGRPVAAEKVAKLERALGAPIPPGRYWYDARSGLGGPWGGAARVYLPGFDFGKVPADASAGSTRVFYNGRELPWDEALYVASLFGIPPAHIPAFAGHYRLEASGDLFGSDGSFRGNLAALAAMSTRRAASDGCTAVRIPSSAPSPTGVKQTIDVATGSGC